MTVPEVTDDMVIACMIRSPRIRRLVREITEEVAICLVRKTGIQQRSANLPERVIAAVCARYGVTAAQLKSPDTQRSISAPRMVAMGVMRQKGMSYPAIGRALGGRDHATIVYGVATCEDRAELRESVVVVSLKMDAETAKVEP